MELYVTELSKYVIVILMLFYTAQSFLVFRYRSESKRSGIYTRQTVFLFLTQIACLVQIVATTGNITYLLFGAFQIIIIFAIIIMYYFIYPEGNRLIINNLCMLLMIGMVMLTRLNYDKAVKQFIIALASIVIGLFVPELVYRFVFLRKFKYIYALAGITMLGVVLVLGSVTNGSKISYTFMGITFQPSEFVKIIFIFFLAAAIYDNQSFSNLLMVAVLSAVHVMILVLSKDLGSALIFFIVFTFMIFIATRNIGYFLGCVGIGAAASIVAYNLFSHVQARVTAWLDPWTEIDSSGYQITQSLFGISSGGWFGLGLFGGTPTTIPFVEADFIFSAIAEELGIIFAVLMTLVCLSTFFMMMMEAFHVRDGFYRLLAVGIAVTYIFQVFLTIGGGTKFIPLTGVTLPLVSYGGSSVLTTIMMFSIFEGICMIRQDEHYQAIEKRRARKSRQSRGDEEVYATRNTR
ncbi:MAG: FtsW/RodA/SpoVE family cell cycle protein [Butyrivibrio sp.]|nr:FtsW/RodA/SpoVE family cell cycle protein [Butyrivibrio sp.]